jgi:cytidine deaminase
MEPEDSKIITLARSARARLGASQGAAVRDETGRTYVAVNVTLPSLELSAIQAAIVVATASGAELIEAVALVADAGGPVAADLAAIRDLSAESATIFVVGPDGALRDRVVAG